MSQSPNYIRPQEEEIDLREELEKYLKHWPWFVMGVIFCLAFAFIYLKYTTPQYSTTASIIIKDEKSKGPSSEMAAFADLGLLGGMGTNSIENEIGILKSKRLMTNVVKELNLNVRYFEETQVKQVELYHRSPLKLQLMRLDERQLNKIIKEEEGNSFRILRKGDQLQVINAETEESISAEIDKAFSLGFAEVVISENTESDPEDLAEVEEILISFVPVEAVVQKYQNQVQVNLTDKNSSLIELSLVDPVKQKAQDILDQLVFEYNKEAIEDKNLVARNTASFIDERLGIINQELDSVEVGKEEFKESNQLTDIQAESSIFIENASQYKQRIQEVGTQLELSRAMIEYLKTGTQSDLLPANLGIEENGINQQIEEYNTLVLERNRVLSGSTERNPVVVRLTSQIDQIKGNILQSLERMRANLEIARQDLERQGAAISSQISAVPAKERMYRGIERQQNIKEALYLFLLEKREENSLSLAVTAPKAKIVDRAYSSNEPVSPKSKIVLLAAFILGLLIPFLFIYLRNLLNNKIRSREDIEKLNHKFPIVGEIPKIGKKEDDLVVKNDRSVLAEAFRIMLTNLQYLFVNSLDEDEEFGKSIITTSTVKGEGKTFVSINLAMTLAITGKKVVLVGADIRNPQLQRYLPNADRSAGVTEFLVDKNVQLDDLIQDSNLHPNLSILLSGSIPPNPAELWRQGRSAELFNQLRTKFDYVIIDSAPSLLVTDTFLINQYADLTLYVTRAGVTDKKMLEFPVDAVKDYKLHDVAMVLNDVDMSDFGYGNKYGYAYGEEEVTFWQRLRGRL